MRKRDSTAARLARFGSRETVYNLGAFTLGAPGTYVESTPGRLVVGNRPGAFHYTVATVFPAIGLGAGWLLWPYVPWFAAIFALLFTVPPILILFNTQRFEAGRGLLRASGKALGRRQERDWSLPPDSFVRIGSHAQRDDSSASRWTVYQAQILTAEGWIGVAESLDREQVVAFADRLADATGVPFVDGEGKTCEEARESVLD